VDPERFARLLEGSDPRALVVEADGSVAGYSVFGANRDPDAAPGVGELRTLFVAPSHWGRGLGSALMAAVLDELAAMGYHGVTLWSFADNHAANRFYEQRGFSRDGAERTEEAWGHILEVRYRRGLGPQAGG
jgi:GNAT superfamily N-acetyltransferase